MFPGQKPLATNSKSGNAIIFETSDALNYLTAYEQCRMRWHPNPNNPALVENDGIDNDEPPSPAHQDENHIAKRRRSTPQPASFRQHGWDILMGKAINLNSKACRCRPWHAPRFIHGIIRLPILLRHHFRHSPGTKFADPAQRSVGGSTIDDYVLDIRIALSRDRTGVEMVSALLNRYGNDCLHRATNCSIDAARLSARPE